MTDSTQSPACDCDHPEADHNIWVGVAYVFKCNHPGCGCRMHRSTTDPLDIGGVLWRVPGQPWPETPIPTVEEK